ncbi:hypothetical protein Tsubulata_031660, partial [Turnera subulata]
LKTNPDFKTLQVLHLDRVDMSSIVPSDILANSSSLVSLSLVGCDLQGEFPARIFQLPKLEVLLLDYNNGLTGCHFWEHIPSSLQNLTRLVYLDLGYNHFDVQDTSSLSWMGHLTKLTHFLFYSSPTTFAFSPTILIPPYCHVHEKSALLQFKDSFIIRRSWACDPKFEGWNHASDCCLWDGIECDPETGHVITLDLSGSCLSGSINSSSSLFQLLHLRSLDLAFNDFNFSRIPSASGHLAKLTYLSLASSNLTGKIPSSFANLTNLSFLYLRYNQLTGPLPPWLGNLTQLTEFAVQYNELQGIVPRSLSQLKNLELLDLSHNKLNGTMEFRELQKLHHLDLSGNFLSLNAETNLNATLPNFIIDDTWGDCDLKSEGWKQASDCCSWDGIVCLFGSINSSSSLFQLLHLRSLNLADNDFYGSLFPSALGHLLTNLTHLNLSYSVFSGPIPSSISNLSKLSSLDLSENAGLELRNPDFKALVRKLDNLQVLHLDLVDMSSTVPNDILAISSSLVSLSLRECYLQGEFPTRIFQLPKLEVLFLDANYNLTGHLPEFHYTTPLRTLSGYDCNFSGHIPSSLQNLRQLVYLTYDLMNCKECFQERCLNLGIWNENKLSGPVELDMFLELQKLYELDLSGNFLSLNAKTNLINATFP